MATPTNPTDRASPPWGLLGAVCLVVLAEGWILRHALDLTPPGAWAFRFSARAGREAGREEVICLGDSLIKHGVAPRVLEARLGHQVVNLACGGGIAPLTYVLFKRALDRGARPPAVLVDFKAPQLQSDPLAVERALVEVLSLSECWALARTARDPAMFARLVVSRALPSVRARLEIRAWASSALGGTSGPQRAVNLVLQRNWAVNRGAGLYDKVPMSETVAEHWDETFHTSRAPWYCHPVNAVYLRRFLELAAERGIRIYWLVPPIHPRVQARRDLLGLDAPFVRMLRRAVQRYPNLTVIDGRGAGYPARHFVDATHLDVEGAYHFSDDLAGVVTLHGGASGPRWLPLPHYRERPIAIPLEDTSASRVALFGVPTSPPARPLGTASTAVGEGRRRRR